MPRRPTAIPAQFSRIIELMDQHLTDLTKAATSEIVAQLAAKKRRIQALAKKRGLYNLRIFGSVARGEAHEASDVDLLVDASKGTSLIDIIGFERELQELLGRKVDVVTPAGLPPEIRSRALAEATPL